MKQFYNSVTALAVLTFLSASALADGNRPPVPFSGSWSYSNSGSRDGKSWSESLSVKESREARFADIQVEEMVNGVKHKKRQKHVPFKDINTVLERLICEAKKGLEPGVIPS